MCHALAAAAGTTPDRVAVQCVHQHDAPFVCLRAQELLDEHQTGLVNVDRAFFQDCLDEYRDNIFWADLVTRMADKAISDHLGPEYFESMPEEERRRTAEALEKSLWQECARYGIDRLGFILPPSDG